MPTCLDVLADWLAVIAQRIGTSEQPSLSISLEANAEANAQAAAYANAQAFAAAASAADSISVAMNIVDIDIRVEQTAIMQLILPPVSPTSPPILEDYPEEKTGVSTTVVTAGIDGPVCQLIYMYLEAITQVMEFFGKFTAPLYMISSAVMFYLEVSLKAAAALGFHFPLPKQAAAAFAAALAGDIAAGGNPQQDIADLVFELRDGGGIGQMACLIYDAYADTGGDSFRMAEAAQGYLLEDFGTNNGARVAMSILCGPSVWAAAIYAPSFWDIPSTSHVCDECGM